MGNAQYIHTLDLFHYTLWQILLRHAKWHVTAVLWKILNSCQGMSFQCQLFHRMVWALKQYSNLSSGQTTNMQLKMLLSLRFCTKLVFNLCIIFLQMFKRYHGQSKNWAKRSIYSSIKAWCHLGGKKILIIENTNALKSEASISIKMIKTSSSIPCTCLSEIWPHGFFVRVRG